MRAKRIVLGLLLLPATLSVGTAADYYTEPQVYGMRPNPNGEVELGPIGTTGIEARIYKGVTVTVEATQPGTPADGKFSKGDILVGVNGAKLKGKNPFVVLGNALTEAEAGDGVLTFDVTPGKDGPVRQVTLRIPVLGAYSKTFPLHCAKSDKIVEQAAAFYAGKDRLKKHNFFNALACLFLLSTGDDAYVPRVKEYFCQFLNGEGGVKGLGDMTWDNGYNGVACAEYYLRTGDRSVLPILQHYCDDAKSRQHYGLGWGHWGHGLNPAYEAGGGMQHSAGNQMLLTLLMGKMCGVDVDDKALLGALKHWYRFAGHGAIPLADQRYWCIFRSAGRDGATAAVMHIASAAEGDVSIYREAKEYLSMSVLTSWPERAYNWEVIWHSLSGAFMLDYNAEMYHQTQQRFRWSYDLHRQASGAFSFPGGHPTLDATDAGISLALAFTAPRKTLHITGAPRSKFAVDFSLPAHLWGNEADRAFLSIQHHPDFYKYGEEDEPYIPFRQLPIRLQYGPQDVKELPLDMMLKNVRHARCSVRAGAAKALCMNKQYGELEKLLRDPDPRLRRAALDGINDIHPWFTAPVIGRQALKAEAYTPAMCEAITKILADPEEAWFVVDAALLALNHAPIGVVEENISRILPWTTHEEWWLRESAFMALMGLQTDQKLFMEYLPTLIEIMTGEYRYNPRAKMTQVFTDALAEWKNDSEIGRMIVAGFAHATMASKVLPDVGKYPRSREGTVNVMETALASIKHAPEGAPDLAEALVKGGRVETFDTLTITRLLKSADGDISDRFIGLYPALETVPPQQKQRLADILYKDFRPELIKRLKAGDKENETVLINLILDLNRLEKPVAGWQALGEPKPAERIWRYHAFDPLTEKDRVHPRLWERFRTAALPAGMETWMMPAFDDSAWKRGATPIGIGVFKAHGHGKMWTATPNHSFKNKSDWGDGEFLLMRTTFEAADADLDHDYYRIRLLTAKGYTIYLNGKQIKSYPWSSHFPKYEMIMLGDAERTHLKKGANTLAVYCMVGYEKDEKTEDYHTIGQIDLSMEGLKKADLGLGK